jgi:hypothetical protein
VFTNASKSFNAGAGERFQFSQAMIALIVPMAG